MLAERKEKSLWNMDSILLWQGSVVSGIRIGGIAAEDIKYPCYYARDLREILARAKDSLMLEVNPLPPYLGDPIPITGNGVITNDK